MVKHNCEWRISEPIDIDHGIFGIEPKDDKRKSFAVKSFPKSKKSNRQDELTYSLNRRGFHRERNLLAKLSHPNIVSVYPVDVPFSFAAEYAPFFVMDRAECSLLKVLGQHTQIPSGTETGNYSFNHCLTYASQISSALAYLHGRSEPIIHRDLKSSNILLFDQGRRCKLCDFDLSVLVESTESVFLDTRAVGTRCYMAPELLAGADGMDGKVLYSVAVDLYSLGLFICEALYRCGPNEFCLGRPSSKETEELSNSRVDFANQNREKVLYLCNTEFASDEVFQVNMCELRRLLQSLLSSEAGQRLAASEVLATLRSMTSQIEPKLSTLQQI